MHAAACTIWCNGAAVAQAARHFAATVAGIHALTTPPRSPARLGAAGGAAQRARAARAARAAGADAGAAWAAALAAQKEQFFKVISGCSEEMNAPNVESTGSALLRSPG